LSYEEHFTIEKLLTASASIRTIATFLNRSPRTIAREGHNNSVKNVYGATKAHGGAYVKRWRGKQQCLKVAMNTFLRCFMEEKLNNHWSPEQISGYLRRKTGIVCKHKGNLQVCRKQMAATASLLGMEQTRERS
jgi:IS30 family transposase